MNRKWRDIKRSNGDPARAGRVAERVRIEGVPYTRYVIRYTLTSGKRRRMTRWSPGFPWVREEVARELCDRYGLDAIKPGSVTITPVEAGR